jgi:hypothetical protein
MPDLGENPRKSIETASSRGFLRRFIMYIRKDAQYKPQKCGKSRIKVSFTMDSESFLETMQILNRFGFPLADPNLEFKQCLGKWRQDVPIRQPQIENM